MKKVIVFSFLLIFMTSTNAIAKYTAKSALDKALQDLETVENELDQATQEYNSAVDDMEAQIEAFEAQMNDQGDPRVLIRLTYPAGTSPRVFTQGWIFGAEVLFMADPEDEEGEPENLSDIVEWSGSGSFSPDTGKISRPSFYEEGSNEITLSVDIEDTTISKTFKVIAVSPFIYAHVGTKALCPSHSHGCPACPHPNVIGPVITGSSIIMINGKPAARVGDTGIHASCCGPNTFEIISGDPNVLIEGKPAARIGDKTLHCGIADGKLVGE